MIIGFVIAHLLLIPALTRAEDVPTDPATPPPCTAPTGTPTNPETPPPASPPPTTIPATPPPKVVLNEIYPDPVGKDEDGEFIELRNNGDADVDLSGWSIKDAGEKIFTVQSVKIPTHGEWTFVHAESHISLNNEGERLTLADPAGVVADDVTFNAHGHSGEAYARSDSNIWQWTLHPTPGSSNIIETKPTDPPPAAPVPPVSPPPAATPVDPPATPPAAPEQGQDNGSTQPNIVMVSLAAFLPNPVGLDDTEWIEISNDGDSPAALNGWSIDDDVGGSSPYPFTPGDVVESRSTLRLMKARTHIALNNDRDAVRLIAPDGSIKESVPYANPAEGKIYAKKDGAWTWTDTGTSASSVPLSSMTTTADPEPPPPDAGTPAQLAATEIGTSAAVNQDLADSISGIVTLAPGRIGKATFLLVDEAGRGLVVRMYGKAGPTFSIGDSLTIRGKMHDSDAQPWVSVSNGGIALAGKRQVLRYEAKDIAEISDDDSALPVTIRGTLTGHGSRWLKLADADGQTEIKAALPPGSVTGPLDDGSTVEASGIVHKTSKGFELLLLSKKQLATIAPADKTSGSQGSERAPLAAAAPDNAAPRQPLVLASVEKKTSQRLYAVIGVVAAASVVGIALWWRKKIPVA